MLKELFVRLQIKYFRKIALLSIIFLVIITIVIFVNRFNLIPKKSEIILMRKFYGIKLKISKSDDILKLQNYTLQQIKDGTNGTGEIEIKDIINLRRGICFHRSLLMQKALLLNGIRVRPVFLFSNEHSGQTNMLDFFSREIHSHNIFEFKWKGNWYVMRTNSIMNKFQSLDAYLKSQRLFKFKPRFIRYLNNRNGRFIPPSFLPDIYFF